MFSYIHKDIYTGERIEGPPTNVGCRKRRIYGGLTLAGSKERRESSYIHTHIHTNEYDQGGVISQHHRSRVQLVNILL